MLSFSKEGYAFRSIWIVLGQARSASIKAEGREGQPVAFAGLEKRPETSDDCLVIVKTSLYTQPTKQESHISESVTQSRGGLKMTFNNVTNEVPDETHSKARSYRFVLGGDPAANVDVRPGFTAIVIRSPGITLSCDPGVLYAPASLPYEPGKLVIADFMFATSELWEEYRELPLEEKDRLLNYFKNSKAYDEWTK